MTDSIHWQKARIMRAAEMARRAAQRGDATNRDHWVAQFAVEVRRLNAMEGRK